MIKISKVMLAVNLLPPHVETTDENILAALQKLRYPVLASVKLDGVRALRLNGTLVSRTFKEIPNKSIRERSMKLPGGFDMELWNPELSYNEIQGIVMSKEHADSDKIQFHILDWCREETYGHRCTYIVNWLLAAPSLMLDVRFETPITRTNNIEVYRTLLAAERDCAEGICFRTPMSPYKQGRSTLKEQYLVKLCRWIRDEVKIVGFGEQIETGKRAMGKQTLGYMICEDKNGNRVDVGSGVGLTERLRQFIWDNQSKYNNKTITIKYKPCGTKDVARHPIFVGFREDV